MNLKRITKKILINFGLDIEFLCLPTLNLLEKIDFILSKYKAILFNKKRIKYFGNELCYDNPFTPALLQSYPNEVIKLSSHINFLKTRNVIDIGGNIGQFGFTLKSLFPQISLYSFEPNGQIIKLLKTNAKNFKNWKVFEYAINEKASSSRDFFFIENKSGQGSFERIYAEENLVGITKKIKVKTISLDTLTVKKLGLPTQVDLVKIDVEGSECSVIKALSGIAPKHIYFEYRTSTNKLRDIEKTMRDYWGIVKLIAKSEENSIRNLLYKVF